MTAAVLLAFSENYTMATEEERKEWTNKILELEAADDLGLQPGGMFKAALPRPLSLEKRQELLHELGAAAKTGKGTPEENPQRFYDKYEGAAELMEMCAND